ncbi:unnamed protein product [Cylicocyclus nassatus]|uniref:Uncharacterized protein n=1 Tax=Cylicocyclus nassatus TaxID=53992 RepID=A0AA36GQT9_CYLNA|nr:unnamed protein product [Cylicocyclus nassatus]
MEQSSYLTHPTAVFHLVCWPWSFVIAALLLESWLHFQQTAFLTQVWRKYQDGCWLIFHDRFLHPTGV